MSYANGTQFYNLPQTVGTDKRDWFDTNSAFAALDAALHAAVTGQAADAEAISAILASLATDEANIAALQTASTSQAASISALQTIVTTQAAQIADVRQDAEDMITANNEGAAATSTRAYAVGDYFIYNDVLYKATETIAIGDTIVPNTNCEATNVDTEISEIKSDLINGKILAQATGDGVKTISQLLDSVSALINANYTTEDLVNSKLEVAGSISYPINVDDMSNLIYGYTYVPDVGTTIQTFTNYVKLNSSTRIKGQVASDGTVSFTHGESSVLPSGKTVTIYI